MALGDPNDWVSVRYLVANGQNAGRVAGSLSEARATIIRYADKYASDGPWSEQQFTHLEILTQIGWPRHCQHRRRLAA